jgi:hypothetical protein
MKAPQPIPDTLGNLPSGHFIAGLCRHCGRKFDVPIPVLVEKLGPDFPTVEAMKKVTCKNCGRPADTWRGSDGRPR